MYLMIEGYGGNACQLFVHFTTRTHWFWISSFIEIFCSQTPSSVRSALKTADILN